MTHSDECGCRDCSRFTVPIRYVLRGKGEPLPFPQEELDQLADEDDEPITEGIACEGL